LAVPLPLAFALLPPVAKPAPVPIANPSSSDEAFPTPLAVAEFEEFAVPTPLPTLVLVGSFSLNPSGHAQHSGAGDDLIMVPNYPRIGIELNRTPKLLGSISPPD